MTDYAIVNARFHRRLYRVCAALAQTDGYTAIVPGLIALADKHAELAARWREVA